ncbi:DEAD/DEAH box helicase [Cellulomonas sp. HD19AZ1]|uniref:DEAD/DEAH box helicase n=1 Tax=Cellulomonas sp. HD19AZ1 TaxID=2559593 RepID=UPI00107134E9|nr:DEAD/DEAH box helicase [Cellulomonas sp. HD19AZ1]TFH68200.1 DEAD/DEAH box helicase [Cellulomonas sp. HD19AZ1]
MDRALATDHVAGAFGEVTLSELPTVDELTELIAELEIELVRGLTEDGFRADLAPLRRAAWYLHGIASTAEASRYPAAQRRRAFAVSAHVLDLLLEDAAETGRDRLATAFAAQVGYHRADESPNAGAILRRMRLVLLEPTAFTESAEVALQAGILLLGLDMSLLNQHLRAWASAATVLTRDAQLDSLDGTTFGPTQRLLRGITDLTTYLREGNTQALENAHAHLLLVLRAEVGLSDLDTRWVAGHVLRVADELSRSSVWAVLPGDVPAAVKQAFTLDRQPVLTLWPPQRSLVTHPTLSPLNPDTKRLLVSVPTSAGKTLLAQLIICAHTAQDERDVCYVTPLRSLGREMRQSLRSRLRYIDRRLGADLPDGFGTEDLTSDEPGDTDNVGPTPQVEVMTPERLMNALRQSPQEVLSRFSLFIIDEAHLIAQRGGRGLLLEGLLSLLDASSARLMLFSGVIGNAASLAAWTSSGTEEVLFTDEWRAPRRLHILTATDRIEASRTDIPGRRGGVDKIRYDLRAQLAVRPTRSTERRLVTSDDTPIGQLVLRADNRRKAASGNTAAYETTARTATHLLRAGSLLMVVSQRNIARNAARVMASELEDDPRSQGLADSLAARLGTSHPLIDCVRKGVAYHHAGLPVEVQEAVEDAIRAETIKAVVATSTLTDGVNLPVRTVVIATTEYDGQDPGQRMSAAQLLNAVGRAGRAGKESEGWIVLALQKALEGRDFERLAPTPADLEVRSTLADTDALAALAEAEALVAETQDAILRLPPDRAAGGFVNYVWFILHALELVPDLRSTRTWRDVVNRLFAFTQLPEDLRWRWLRLAEVVAARYQLTPQMSRRRWAQAGTSLGSAAAIESIAAALADGAQLRDVGDELSLAETLEVLAAQDVYAQLLQLPERGRSWRFRTSPRGEPIEVATDAIVRDWIAGRDLTDLANTHLSAVIDPAFRLEQMVDGISEGVQHYLSWTVGLVVAQANEILLSRFSPVQLFPTTSAHLRYGVDTPLAVDLLVRDVKSRALARDLGRIARDLGLDVIGLREYLSEQHIGGWRASLGATPTDVLDLLQYVQGADRHKLSELMETGSVTAQMRPTSEDRVSERAAALPVTIVPTSDGDEFKVIADGAVFGIIVARDHAGVAAVLDSGVLVDVNLRGTTVTITRAVGGQLSFL